MYSLCIPCVILAVGNRYGQVRLPMAYTGALSEIRAKDQRRIRLHPRFASRYLSTPRDIVVYLPPGYDSGAAPCPVLYLQDGQNLFDPHTAFGGQDWRADVTADDLILRGAIEPLIVVGIYNTGVRRVSEYTPTKDPRRRKGGKGDRYAKMMAQELKPFIDREYRTRRSAAHNGRRRLLAGRPGLARDRPAVSARLRPARHPLAIGMVGQSIYSGNGTRLQIRGRGRASGWIRARTKAMRPSQTIADLRTAARCPDRKGLARRRRSALHRSAGRRLTMSAPGRARFGEVLQYLFPREPREENSGEPA